MVTIAGIWDFSWTTPSEEMFYWEGVVREFHTQFVMSPVTGIRNKYVTEVHDYEEFINSWKGTKIFVSEEGKTELADFVHPGKALYIFGRSNYSPFNHLAKQGDLSIKISTADNRGMMLSPVAASIVMYDRFKKWHLQ